MARIREGCDCGCNDPVARNPKDMLVFLARRFEHAGVAESVASIYAYDIKLILKEHYGIDLDSEARIQTQDNRTNNPQQD